MDDSDSSKQSRRPNRSTSDTYALARSRAEAGNTIRDIFIEFQERIATARDDLNVCLSKIESKLIKAYHGAPGTTVEDVVSTQDPKTLLNLVKDDAKSQGIGELLTKLALQPLLTMAQSLRRPVGRSAHLLHEYLLDFPEPFAAKNFDNAGDKVYLEDQCPGVLLKMMREDADELYQQHELMVEKRDIIGRFIEKFNKTLTPDMRDDRESWIEYAAILNLNDPRGQDKGTWDESLEKLVCYHQRKYVEGIEKVCQKVDLYTEALHHPKLKDDLSAAAKILDQ